MRLILPFILLAGLLGLSVFWDKPLPAADVTIAYSSFETFDPQRTRASDDVRMAYAMFQGLATFDSFTFSIEPGVAERWEISDDGLTYIYHLRHNAKWSDGSPVTAEDFRANWRQGMMPDVSPPYIEFLQFIRGGKAYFNWCVESLKRVTDMPGDTDEQLAAKLAAAKKRIEDANAKFDELVGVQVPDDYTLVIELERPTPYFLEISACWPLFPAHRPTLEGATSLSESTYMLYRDPQWTKAGRLVGNGPYVLKEWRFKGSVYLERNPHYWDQSHTGPPTIEYVCITAKEAKFNAYASGSVDIYLNAQEMFDIAPDLVQQTRAGIRNDVHDMDAFGTYYYLFNCRETLPDGRANPFRDPRLRKAFSLAVDRKTLVEQVTRLRQSPSHVFVPEGVIPGYPSPVVEDKPYAQAAEEARRLLAEAGYPGGAGLGTIELTFNTSGGHEKAAEGIANMWEKALGVKVRLGAMEWKVFLEKRIKGDYVVARAGWFGDYMDPTTFLDLFVTGNGNNDSGYSDPTFDAMMAKAADTLDVAERMKLLSDAERYAVVDQMVILPLYRYKVIHLFDPTKVQGVSLHPRNLQMMSQLKVMR